MFRIASLLFLLCSTAIADTPLTITSNGYYLTQVDEEGTPSLVKVTRVIDLTNGSTPLPPETPIPVPPIEEFDTAVVNVVAGWAKDVNDPDACQAVSLVYHHILQAIEDNLLPEKMVWEITRLSTDNALKITGSKDWSNFRNQLSEIIAEKTRKGELASNKQIVQLMKSIRQGMEMAADGSTALNQTKAVAVVIGTNEVIDGYR